MKTRLLTLVVVCLATVSVFAQAPQSFMYQAVARNTLGGLLANQPVSFQLTIYEGGPAGTVVYQEVHGVATNLYGLVNIEVGSGLVAAGDISNIDWSNGAYFLETALDPAGGFAFIVMGTTQLLSVPYALHAGSVDNVDDADADPANEIQTLTLSGDELSISGGNTVTIASGGGGNTLQGAYDQGGLGAGRIVTADNGSVEVNITAANDVGLDCTSSGNGSVAIAGESTLAANGFSSIQSITNSNSILASAVVGNSDGAAWGVTGQVTQFATAQSGLYGSNFRTNGGHGVLGQGFNGVVGETDYRAGFGLWGYNYDNIGSFANLAIGTAGIGYYGVLGEDLYLGAVAGAFGVFCNGDFGATGVKAFQIDHPADPENKLLRHFCLESNEVLNVYRGNVELDQNGEAVVNLPEYFELINRNFSYQLTPIGAPANLYIKKGVEENAFEIAGGTSGMSVSWVVHAERNDPYLQAFPEKRADVLVKSEREKGKFYIPSLYGAGDDQRIIPHVERTPQMKQNIQR